MAGNVDTIHGFATNDDHFQLDAFTFRGTLASDQFVVNALPADCNDHILYNQTTGQLFFDRDGNGAAAAVQFATLHPGTVLHASDFIVL